MSDDMDTDYLRDRTVLETGDPDGIRDLAASVESRPEILYYLAEADDPEVRGLVAANPATPAQADEILCGDGDRRVRGHLARKVARRLDSFDPDTAARLVDSARTVLRRLAGDQAVEVRRIVAEEVRLSTAIPREVALALARDIDEGVCCPVLEFSPLLDDDDLIELIDARLASPALAAIARRENLGERVSDGIAGTLDEQAVAALLSNASAQIRETTIDMIIDAAPERTSWHVPLIGRENLNGSAIRRIAGFVADELIEAIALRDDITTKMVDELRGLIATRVNFHVAETPEDLALLDALEGGLRERLAAGKLTPGYIAEAAEQGRHAEVWIALGLLAGTGRGFAHRVFASRNAKAIVALSWLANLPAWLTVVLQSKISAIPDKDCLKPRGASGYPLSEKDMLWQLDLFGYRAPGEMAG